MVDIDHFKRVNDDHGHDVGDKAICAVAKELKAEAELVGRLGGEEFAILLAGRSLNDAMTAAERLRRRIAAMRIESGAAHLSLTCSFGVSDWQTGDGIDRLLRRADAALYEAKIGGRDRVVAADRGARLPSEAEIGHATRIRA
jgi:diguanylate cyclase (GGDEF)-like protein